MGDLIVISKEDLQLLIKNVVKEAVRTALSELPNSPVIEENIFLDAAEAATFLHKKISTIYFLVRNRRIPVYKDGNKLLSKYPCGRDRRGFCVSRSKFK